MKVKHYALSGFACNGKTTLIKTIKGFIPEGYLFVGSQEVAREAKNVFDFFGFKFDQKAFEQSILTSEVTLLKFIDQLKKLFWLTPSKNKNIKGIVIMQDRPVFDVLAFMVARGIISVEKAIWYLQDLDKTLFDQYDKVFIVGPINDVDFIMNNCLVDPLRMRTVSDFQSLQDKFYTALDKIVSEVFNEENMKDEDAKRVDIVKVEHPYYNSQSSLIVISKILDDLKGSCLEAFLT